MQVSHARAAKIRDRTQKHSYTHVHACAALQYCRVPKNGGVDGPSLDPSYFSRLQPISFLFFDPSSSHIACSAHTVLDIYVAHARNACRAGEAAEMFRPVDVEFRSQQYRGRSRLDSKRCLRVVLNSIFQPVVVLIFRKIPAWPFFRKPFFGTRQYCMRFSENAKWRTFA